MKARIATAMQPQQLRGTMLFALVSAVTLVMSSMDQCTRGPSVTAMLLTHAGRLI